MLSNKEINKLAIPAILFNITEPLIGLVDTAIIGQIDQNATLAQGGVGLSAGLFATLIWGFAQMRTSLSAIISRNYGSNALHKVKSLIPQTIILTASLGVIMSLLLSYYFKDVTFFLFGEMDPLTFKFSMDYFIVRSYGLPIGLTIALFFGVFRGFQNTSWAMYISLIGGTTNIVLDYIFVLGWDPFIEPLGVKGAAWAAVIAQIVMLVLCVIFYLKNTPFNLKLSKKISPFFTEMIGIFINMFLRTMVLNLVFIISNRFANGYGSSSLAAYTIAYNIWIFTSFFIDGYANAGNALAGKFLGEKNNIKLKVLGNKLLFTNIKIAVILMLAYSLVYFNIGYAFNDNPEVITLFETTFWIVIIAQPFNAIAFTFDGIFKGLGRAKELRNTLIAATFIVFIPTIYLLDIFTQGLHSIWIALSLWMIYRGGSLLIKFKSIVNG